VKMIQSRALHSQGRNSSQCRRETIGKEDEEIPTVPSCGTEQRVKASMLAYMLDSGLFHDKKVAERRMCSETVTPTGRFMFGVYLRV
jgi:hypothetical protein